MPSAGLFGNASCPKFFPIRTWPRLHSAGLSPERFRRGVCWQGRSDNLPLEATAEKMLQPVCHQRSPPMTLEG